MPLGGRFSVTLPDLVGLLLRRWYVAAAAIVLATALTILWVRDGGVYTTKTVVVFTIQKAPLLASDNGSTDENQIAFAGAVAQEITKGRPALRYAGSDAPYYGAGIRQGTMVGLPKYGGQWMSSFTRAEIEVHIVGPTYAWVESEQRHTLQAIEQLTVARQASVTSEDPSTHVVAQVDPWTTSIEKVAPSSVSRVAAAMAMGIAALLSGVYFAIVLDKCIFWRRVRYRLRDAEGELRGAERNESC